MKATTCRSRVCDLPSFARGLCRGHYGRWHRKGEDSIHTPLRAISPPGSSANPCTVPTCVNKVGKSGAKGLCWGHYSRLLRTGDVQADKTLIRKRGICAADDCELPTQSHGYCGVHSQRFVKTGDPQAHIPIRKRVAHPGTGCRAPECPAKRARNGYCSTHARRFEVGGEAALAGPKRVIKYTTACVAKDCDERAVAKDLCQAHYYRLRNGGDLREGAPIRQPVDRTKPCVAPGCDRLRRRGELCQKHYMAQRQAEIRADPERHEAQKAYMRDFANAFRINNPERYKATVKAWRLANPAKYRAGILRRRLRESNAPRLPYTDEQLVAKVAYWGDRCWVCGGPYQAIDHMKPLSRGGSDILANLRPICTSDNSSKNANWPWDPAKSKILRSRNQ